MMRKNVPGNIIMILMFIYVLYSAVLSIGTPFVFNSKDFFGLISASFENHLYTTAILVILKFAEEVFELGALTVWLIWYILGNKKIKVPVTVSFAFMIYRIVYEVLLALFSKNFVLKEKAVSYAFILLGFAAFLLLVIDLKTVNRIIFLAVGLVTWIYTLPGCVSSIGAAFRVRLSFGNFVSAFLTAVEILLQIVLYISFVLYVFKPELFFEKSSEKED